VEVFVTTVPNQDLVDVFYADLVRPLGNLVILFAQAEASLLAMVSALKGIDAKQAQVLFKSKDAKTQILALVTSSGLQGFALSELTSRIEQYWLDRDARNRLIHDDWFVVMTGRGYPATRGLPLRKGSDVVFGDPTPEHVWQLASAFLEHMNHFEHVVWQRSRNA
jgi:hypothetical protein